jgi:hypothetical protein
MPTSTAANMRSHEACNVSDSARDAGMFIRNTTPRRPNRRQSGRLVGE